MVEPVKYHKNVKLPVALANTRYVAAGQEQDALMTAADLAGWLRAARPELATPLAEAALAGVTQRHVEAARSLREAIRSVASASTGGESVSAAELEAINAVGRAASMWVELRGSRVLQVVPVHSGDAVDAALAEVAHSAVEMLAAAEIWACGAPSCIKYFAKDHPRKEWCSDSCGNRVRAARHYARTRHASG